MNIDAREEYRTNSNWRAHVNRYMELKKEKGKNYSLEKYCEEQQIDCKAFKSWMEHIKKEDKYFFYTSLADIYLQRAKCSLELLKEYMNIPKLRMPLIRDTIIAYASLFTKSDGRVLPKQFSLNEIEGLVPDNLQVVHEKIRSDRDTIIAHCDIKPKNPRVGVLGTSIRMAGCNWEDYKKLISELEELILIIQEKLQAYNKINFDKNTYFQYTSNVPACAEEDPGPPSGK